MQALLQTSRLKVAQSLPEAKLLTEELLAFKAKVAPLETTRWNGASGIMMISCWHLQSRYGSPIDSHRSRRATCL
jgi:hypothetical protein